MTAFFCNECENPFKIEDSGIAQAMVYEHLATGDGFVCPSCSPVTVSVEVPLPLYSFEKEENNCEIAN